MSTRPKLDDLEVQPTPFDQLAPVVLRTLQSRQLRHHQDVACGGLPIRARLGDHAFEDQYLAVAGLHGIREAGQDLPAHLIRPVVEDGVHEVSSRSFDRLLGQEVVAHQLDRAVDIRDVADDDREILEDEILGGYTVSTCNVPMGSKVPIRELRILTPG